MENKKIGSFIVITSIFNPTKSVQLFAKMNGYNLIVVGDKKTPQNWVCENVDFISVQQQDEMNYQLTKLLPYNHYCRKMIGYITAIHNGAECIIDTDDDNVPKENWNFPSFENNFDYIPENKGFVNIYQLYTTEKVWPRGFPLNLINEKFCLENEIVSQDCNVGIWQGLADEDPDVDAIFRLTHDEPIYFENRNPVVLGKGTISPFNTQNTIIRKELFPLLYLPTHVTFRYTDILRGLVAQPIMWLYGYHLGFINATVVQKRNPHDYMVDFISEIPMYKTCEKVIELVDAAISSTVGIKDNLYNAYLALLKNNIVCDQEMETLQAWLNDIQ